MITQDTFTHNAKVKMTGLKNMYECTRCHKFIHADISKDKESGVKDDAAPEYLENELEDDN